MNKESGYLSCVLNSASERKILGESLLFTCYVLSICDVEWMVLTAFAQESVFNYVMIIKYLIKEEKEVTGRLLSVQVD